MNKVFSELIIELMIIEYRRPTKRIKYCSYFSKNMVKRFIIKS